MDDAPKAAAPLLTQSIKICVIGPQGSGKTSLTRTLCKDPYLDNNQVSHNMLGSNNNTTQIEFENQQIVINFMDTSSDPESDALRLLSYRNTDLFLVCMDISNTASFLDQEIVQKWIPGINSYYNSDDMSIILVGCKSDLRTSFDGNKNEQKMPELLSIRKCEEMCIQITEQINNKCLMFIEVSAECMGRDEIQLMLQEIYKAEEYGKRPRRLITGHQLPKKHLIDRKQANEYNSGVEQEKHKISTDLLIAGYIKKKNSGLQIPKEIGIVIKQFYYYPKIHLFYNYSTENRKNANFVSDKVLERNFYIMLWTDLIAIIIHNIGWLCFGVQLFIEYGGGLGIAALCFSILESMIIIGGYLNLWLNPKIEYYTEGMNILHTIMEFFANLPMIIILFLYLFNTENALIPSFYVALAIYLLYGAYKCIFTTAIWSDRTELRLERDLGPFICFFTTIWMISMISLVVIGSVYTAKDMKKTIGIILICIASICCCGVGLCGYYIALMTSLMRTYAR